ncbi:MAG: hypothetical protein H7Z37_05470 [Pyrinomonadaceae bacterium]|nr:hypothetical protein [Pyrinomonadaceae bacterium]
MKSLFFAIAIISFSAVNAAETNAQAKGIDTQNQQTTNVDNKAGSITTGTGRGIDFGGKPVARTLLNNPYRLASKRDILLTTIANLMTERNLVVDEASSRLSSGIVVSAPFVFAKGAVITTSQLSRYANLPESVDDNWTRGRYTLTVDVQSIDGTNNNVSVTAKVEGRAETLLGGNWQTLNSTGEAENDFLAALVERVTGVSSDDAPKLDEPSPEELRKAAKQDAKSDTKTTAPKVKKP